MRDRISASAATRVIGPVGRELQQASGPAPTKDRRWRQFPFRCSSRAEIAQRVGPRGAVHGVDPSKSMLATAARRRAGEPTAPVSFGTGDALALPFPDGSFDAVTATQVYEYVADMPAALAEARRVLRPAGRLLILDTDWDSLVWHSSDPARMRRVLTAWDEHLADPHLPCRLGRLLADAGFTVARRHVHPVLNAGYDANTFSAGVIDLVADFVPGRAGVTDAETQARLGEPISSGSARTTSSASTATYSSPSTSAPTAIAPDQG